MVILYFLKKLYTVYNMSININVSSRSLCGDVYCYVLVLAPALKHWCCYALPRFLWVKWPSNHEIESSYTLMVFNCILKNNLKSESFQILNNQWFGLKKEWTKWRNCRHWCWLQATYILWSKHSRNITWYQRDILTSHGVYRVILKFKDSNSIDASLYTYL